MREMQKQNTKKPNRTSNSNLVGCKGTQKGPIQLAPQLDEFLDTTDLLKPQEKLVLRKLLKLRIESGTDLVRITFSDLAKRLGILRITVRRATDKLIEKGFLVYEGSYIEDGVQYHKRHYRLPSSLPGYGELNSLKEAARSPLLQ